MVMLFCARCGWKAEGCFALKPQPGPSVPPRAVGRDVTDSEDEEESPSPPPAPPVATSFRGDVFADTCKECASVVPTRGFVFGLLLDGELVYVGRSTVSMAVRQDRMWYEALEPRSKGYRSLLSGAIREVPDRGRWRVVTLQETSEERLAWLELAWKLHAAPAGRSSPRLNSFPPPPEPGAMMGLPMWSVHGAELALHMVHVPRLPAGVFFELLRCDPEALKRVYMYVS